jgi:hypothetical protein
MPSLNDLSGTPPAGYETVVRFVDDDRPDGWFVERDGEFSPPLLVLGTFYDVKAAGEWAARVEAGARFLSALAARGLPDPVQGVYAEPADG